MNRLHWATVIVAFLPKLAEAFRSLVPFLAFSFFTNRGDTTELIVAAIGVLGGFGAISTYLTTRFGIEGEHLVWTSGWLWKKDRRIPLDQVQNVNLKQGLLERLLGVATVEVETAAGSTTELKLQVLSQERADEFRNEVLRGAHAMQPEHAPVQIEEKTIYSVSSSDLFLGAITENQGFRIIFILIPALGGGALIPLLALRGAIGQAIPLWVVWLGVIGAVGAVVVIGWIIGGVSYAMRYANFSVKQEGHSYRIGHGLLTKIQYSIRRARVEFAQISATPWQRWAKRCTVHVGTAGSFGEQGTLAPLALMLPSESAPTAIGAVLPRCVLNDLQWRRLPIFYLVMISARTVLWALLIVMLASWVSSLGVFRAMPVFFWLILLIFALMPLMGLIDTLLAYRRSGYAVTGDVLAVRLGFFVQRTSIMPLEKVEVVGMSRPPWWKRRGMTTFFATGMVHSLAIPVVPERYADEIAALVEEQSRQRAERRKEARLSEARATLPEQPEAAEEPLEAP